MATLSYSPRRAALIGDESEEHFMGRVRRLARMLGWDDHHTRDSIGTRHGEPDLRLLRPPRYVLAELKSQHGRLTTEQSAYIAKAKRCRGIEVYVWRPSDWDQILEVLR